MRSQAGRYNPDARKARIIAGVCVACKEKANKVSDFCDYHHAVQKALQRDYARRKRYAARVQRLFEQNNFRALPSLVQ